MRLSSLRHIPFFGLVPILLILAWDSPWAPGCALLLTGALLPLYKPREPRAVRSENLRVMERPRENPEGGHTGPSPAF